MAATFRIEPDITSAAAGKRLRDLRTPNATGGFATAIGFAIILALGSIEHLLKRSFLPALALAIAAVGVAYLALAVYRFWRLRIGADAERKRAGIISNYAARLLAEFNHAIEDAANAMSHATHQIGPCEEAFERHALASFWDACEILTLSLQAITHNLGSAAQSATGYQSTLAGQHHTFPRLALTRDFSSLADIAQRFMHLLAKAETQADFVMAFGQVSRRQRGPSFAELRESPTNALTARTTVLSALRHHPTL